MRFTDFLVREWRPALGCTEPASIAWATSLAAATAGGSPEHVTVVCDPRLYKNCYAVGIPNSGRRSGVLWTAALGAWVAEPDARLEIFGHLTPKAVDNAGRLIAAGQVEVTVDPQRTSLFADCRVRGRHGVGRVVLEDDHTNVVRIELDGQCQEPLPVANAGQTASALRAQLASHSIAELVDLARSIDQADRALLRQGVEMNLAIAEHGSRLLEQSAGGLPFEGAGGRGARLVSGGVFARMSGEQFSVMTLAGSGNKGITCSVPIAIEAQERGIAPHEADVALALGCLLTSATTHHLGTLSAICGSSNAAGIGLAGGLVMLAGGSAKQVSLAVTNMVGSVSGMICDGAKIGCAMKCMTGVDAAFRSAYFARRDLGIPVTDGIVGADGDESLANLARIAHGGLQAVENEILAIMQEKLARAARGEPPR